MNELLIKQNKGTLKTIPAAVFLVLAFFTLSSYLRSAFSTQTQAMLAFTIFFTALGLWVLYISSKRQVLINKSTVQIEVTEFSFFGIQKHKTYPLGNISSVQSYITHGKGARNIVELVTSDGNRGLLLSSFLPCGGKKFAFSHQLPFNSCPINTILWGMNVRIPPSLKWLLNKRARLLNAVDITLSLHEAPINPEIIEPIKTQTSARKFTYGAIGRLIFTCLKFAGNESRTTTEVAAFVAEYYKVNIEKVEFLQIRTSVKYRLRHLADKGTVKRAEKVSKNVEAHWQLSDWTALKRPDLE